MTKEYKYIIIGGGMTAASAVEGIREIDRDGQIGMFSKEANPPYNRPPLTKGLWQEGEPEVEDIWRDVDEYQNLDMFLKTEITKIDRGDRVITDDTGNEYRYEKLLLATGGDPIKLPFDHDESDVLYYRTFEDFKQLQEEHKESPEMVYGVIGGGFIGAEIAASLRMNGHEVVMVFPEEGVGGTRYPEQLSELITQEYIRRGVHVYPGQLVGQITKAGDRYSIKTESGEVHMVDKIIAGIGIKPNLQLAQQADIETNDGIIVDEILRTSDYHIWAAGDVAEFYSPHLEKNIRIEHAENAKQMGKVAGWNMAGKTHPFDYLPMFYSDMFEMGFEAVGELDPELYVVIDWKKKPEKGVVYYLKKEEGDVRGVILWNVWGKTDEARKVIDSEVPLEPVDLVNLI